MIQKQKKMIVPRLELGTFCVLDRCDNHYTIRSCLSKYDSICLLFYAKILLGDLLIGNYEQSERQIKVKKFP